MFLGIEVGLKVFCTWTLEMLVGLHWKCSSLLTNYSCCWGPLWKQGTYTFNVDVWAPLKAQYLHITVVVLTTLKARYRVTQKDAYPYFVR